MRLMLIFVFAFVTASAPMVPAFGGEPQESPRYNLTPDNTAQINARVKWAENLFISQTTRSESGQDRTENLSIIENCEYSDKEKGRDESGVHFARKFHNFGHAANLSTGKSEKKQMAVSEKTVNLLKTGDGKIGVDGEQGFKENDMSRACEQPDAAFLLPKSPVAVGDTWNSGDLNLRFFAGRLKKRSVDSILAVMKLEKVADDNSSQTASVSVLLKIFVTDAPATYSIELKGILLYDLKKKSATSVSLSGTMDSGTAKENDPLSDNRINGTCKFEMKIEPGKAEMETPEDKKKTEDSK
jgi:hypothetical protein